MRNKRALLSAQEILGSLILAAIFVLPVLSLAGDEDKLYVDDNASGQEDGSIKHPYKTIAQALKKADRDSEVHILPGSYEENIEIPEGVEVFGSDKNSVVIKAEDDGAATVTMKHKSSIDNVTIKDGRYGIKVGTNDRASITECIIKDNKKDGINIKAGEVAEKRKVTISESEIYHNGQAGIYAEKRRLVMVDNEIRDNDSDGIDLQAGTSAWIGGNRLKNNAGSGLKIVLDKAKIWTKNNTYRDNEREGIEVNAYGAAGRIDINKSKFDNNDRYGIARILRGGAAETVFGGLTLQSNNVFTENKVGNISPTIRLNK